MSKHDDILGVDERLKLVRSMRWWHLGYGFTWSVVFVGASTTGTDSDLNAAYQFLQLFACIASIALTAFLLRSKLFSSPRNAIFCGMALSAGSLIFYLPALLPVSSRISVLLQLFGGIVIGAASGYAYSLWQQFFVSEGEGTTGLFIPLSGFISVALCGALAVLPTFFKAVCAIAILPALSSFSLYKSLSEIVAGEPIDQNEAVLRFKAGARHLAVPVLCCCVMGFTWEISTGALGSSGAQSFWATIAGQGLAVIAASVLIFLKGATIETAKAYQAVYPLIMGALCLVLVDSNSFASFSMGSLVFSSELMSMLLLYVVAVYCSSKELEPLPLYAFCMVPLYASMLAGRAVCSFCPVGFEANMRTALVVALFVVSVSILLTLGGGRFGAIQGGSMQSAEKASDEKVGGELKNAEDDRDAAELAVDCRHLFNESLTLRETEVLELITKGNTVAAASRKLFISENTTRSHIKTIYRKAGVHSRQELIDVIEQKRAQRQ